MGHMVTTGAPLAFQFRRSSAENLPVQGRGHRLRRAAAAGGELAAVAHVHILKAQTGEQPPGLVRELQVSAVKTRVVDGHRRPAVARLASSGRSKVK